MYAQVAQDALGTGLAQTGLWAGGNRHQLSRQTSRGAMHRGEMW